LEDESLISSVDILAHEYGWNIEYIQALDMNEISKLLKAISKRKKLEHQMLLVIINRAIVGKPLDDTKYEVTETNQLKELMNKLKIPVKEI
jgi:hypothetical protein